MVTLCLCTCANEATMRAMQAYKYVPFGRVDEVMPYLIRRAQENSTVLGGVQAEKQMMLAELQRRVFRRA